ncbi:PAAR domain-containing protein [Aquisalimonas lutea]|uniref:PAAR domain-containing protein n=1 Tax=Aquisalimonas lutea TaxID=1327750 RepID=UPI00338F16FE
MTASPDVFINGLSVVRLGDALVPHGCSTCSSHPRKVAEGAATVLINGRPASRVGDAVDCGGELATGSPDVFIGG